jgi:hypothetical protein
MEKDDEDTQQDSILQEAGSVDLTKRTYKGVNSIGNEENTLDTTTGNFSGMSPARNIVES